MKKTDITTAAVGAVAGFINGFLGTGGGIVIMLSLSAMNRSKKTDTRDLFSLTVLVTAAFSAVSAVIYLLNGSLPVRESLILLVPAAAGGAFGAFLLDKLSPKILKAVFSLLMIVSGAVMLLR